MRIAGLMLSAFLPILLVLAPAAVAAQPGRVEPRQIEAASLAGNRIGISTQRRVNIYLPPDYDRGDRRYPVIYFLSSFFEDEKVPFEAHGARALFDRAIADGRIGGFILVTADFTTPAGGSWYVNSAATGRWQDFMVRELVPWIDTNYRTIARAGARGIAGDRMGGHGAIRFGMEHPETFSAVYALHPIGMGPGLQSMFSRPNWQLLQDARSIEDLRSDGFSQIFASIFQAFLPDAGRAPLFFTPPARLTDGQLEVDAAVAERLNAAFFLERQVAARAGNLRKLKGLMFDWGRNDSNTDHIVSIEAFARTLDAFGVPYEAEAYRGGWGDRTWGEDGRVYTEMLPFFARHLEFDGRR